MPSNSVLLTLPKANLIYIIYIVLCLSVRVCLHACVPLCFCPSAPRALHFAGTDI